MFIVLVVFLVVQVSLMDCPGKYDKFLQVLTDARKQGWKPSKVGTLCMCEMSGLGFFRPLHGFLSSLLAQIYQKIGVLLHDWPHLMRLFTEFLRPGDTPDAKLVRTTILPLTGMGEEMEAE